MEFEITKDLEWNTKNIKEFQKYLKSLERPEKKTWTKNLMKTEMDVLAIPTPEIKKLVSKIAKTDYLKFLDFMLWDYYDNTAINGFLIPKIKDFDTMKKYLDIYSSKAENWATCDLLSFDVKGMEGKYYDIVLEYIKSDKPFVRRIGMSILFKFIDNPDYIDNIFELLDTFTDEEEYYVNMMNAWLLCECFTRQRSKTLKYLDNHKLNKFTVNKGVQKCRESRRVTKTDADMLLKYKVK